VSGGGDQSIKFWNVKNFDLKDDNVFRRASSIESENNIFTSSKGIYNFKKYY
jgi:hypothetical protein